MVVLNVMNIVWQGAAPTAFASISWKYYLFFIVSMVVPFTFPVTRNRSLGSIEMLFGGGWRGDARIACRWGRVDAYTGRREIEVEREALPVSWELTIVYGRETQCAVCMAIDTMYIR
mgnify:CR=1 FL=1